MILARLDRFRDLGLLLLRVGLGAMFVAHGWPKISGGPAVWEKIGAATGSLGLTVAPTVFGFLAACSEFLGGLGLIAGFFFRPACFLMAATMAVAAAMHLGKGDGFNVASHAIEDGIVFLSLFLIGPGRYGLDARLEKKS